MGAVSVTLLHMHMLPFRGPKPRMKQNNEATIIPTLISGFTFLGVLEVQFQKIKNRFFKGQWETCFPSFDFLYDKQLLNDME